MKRLRTVIVLITLLIFSPKVKAVGGFDVSSGQVNLQPGQSATISISTNNAVGRLDISSSNSNVATVSSGSVFIQTPGSSQSFTITANSVGTARITVTATSNFATMDEERLSGQTKSIVVNVAANTITPGQQNTPITTTNKSNGSKKEIVSSKNNNLKSISVDGYKLEKIDNNNYKLDVANAVEEINIVAEAEDSKASITGTGKKILNVGKNVFEIIIASESGEKNKVELIININPKVSIEDLEHILNTKSNDIIDIDINGIEVVSSNILSKLKKSRNILNLNYNDGNKKYNLIVDGKKLEDFDELRTGVIFNSKYKKKIEKLSNYADGIYVSFKQKSNFPKGVKLKLYVGDKYANGDKINLYYYDKLSNKLILYIKSIPVKKGYITIPLKQNSDYLFTRSNIVNSTQSNINLLIISLIIVLLILLFIIIIIMKKSKTKKTPNNQNKIEFPQINK